MSGILRKIITVIFLLLAIPLLVYGIMFVRRFIIKASVAPANIVLSATPSAQLVPNWQAFAQGGESADNMIRPAVDKIRALQPKFIRLDHLYDFYGIVSRVNGQLNFNFTKLDEVVGDILKTGAQPFFSLSYMPSDIASSDIVSAPKNYAEWGFVVQKTIEHYSGRGGLNLQNVYYEVWNEPDLFGGWRYYGSKNYLDLYYYAAIGASNAKNINQFKLGGPAITAFYENWMRAFLKHCQENNLKLDFLSWHRYTYDSNTFLTEVDKLDAILRDYPQYQNLERHITEAGFNPEVNPGYDSNYSALHLASVFAKLQKKVYQIYTFELVDGLSPKGDEFWGRWGLLTHQSKGLTPKPRYWLFSVLNSFSGGYLDKSGENDFINVIGVRNGDSYKILLVNFDADNMRVENVPVKIVGVAPGDYSYSLTYPLISSAPSLALDVTSGSEFSAQVLMDHNSLAVVELIKK